MGKMKTEFDFLSKSELHEGSAKIVNRGAEDTYVIIDTYRPIPYKQGPQFELNGVDLERFAVNILKALKSKHLKTNKYRKMFKKSKLFKR